MVKKVTFKTKLNYSARFLTNSLSSLINNRAAGLQKKTCKICNSCLKYVNAEDSLLVFKCIDCKKMLIFKNKLKIFRKISEKMCKPVKILRWKH